MSAQTNKAVVRQVIDEVFNQARPERLADLWSAETRPAATEMVSELTVAFPDLQVHIDDLIAEADRVVARLTFTGTHHGPFHGLAPTGRRVTFEAIRIYRLADGVVADTWAQVDKLGLMGQLRAQGR